MAGDIICPKCSASNPAETAYCGKCGERLLGTQQMPEQADPLIGTLVGDRFLVHEKLGEGGMGVVYRAEQTAIKRQVALKVLHSQLTQDESLHARFHNEAEASSRLTHPNTVTIFDFGKTVAGSLYIAMEFIQGISLDDEIRDNGPMDLGRVRHIMAQICGSISDAHAHNIVHRDLKPENIMLCDRAGQKDVVKVLDFGIAKVLEDDGQDQRKALTKTGMVFGTPQYMSPEQIRGERVDHRTDIYSIGVIMYQMITGELPFTADTPMGALSKHLVDDPPRFVETNSEVNIPEAIESVVMATLAKSAEDRPQSMNDLSEQILAASSEFGGDVSTFGVAARTSPGASAGTGTPTAATPAPGQKTGGGAKAGGVLAKTELQNRSVVEASTAAPKKRKKGLFIGLGLAALLICAVAVGWALLQNKTVSQAPATALPATAQPQVAVPQTAATFPPATQPAAVQAPVPALPAAPKDTGSQTGTPKPTRPQQDKKCRYAPVVNDDIIAKALLRKVKGSESALKECIRKGAKGRSTFKFIVHRKQNVLKNARKAGGVNSVEVDSCLQKVFTGPIGVRDSKAAHKGGIIFDVRHNGKTIRKCNVMIQAEVANAIPSVSSERGQVSVVPAKKKKGK